MSIFGVKWSKSRGKSVIFDLGKSVKSKRIRPPLTPLITFIHKAPRIKRSITKIFLTEKGESRVVSE